ncbi:MFS transporter [Cupriavidus lacunae]|uniref:MFS transporter n=1 Tax=Cupriavidus lacunae TaxID=2666307 RepID=A0A370P211_9BURK|nr:MFS transporter [Cupriavidus lacunae]RDK11901.1 MFS transporter [Cupriavidus lacunae]
MSDRQHGAASGLTSRQVFLMALACALAVSAIYYHQPLLPQIAASFGVSPTQGNLIATVTQLGYASGLLLFVPLADSVQPRKLATVAIVGNAIALLACAMAPSFSLLVVSSFVAGATAITAQIIIPSASGMASPEQRGRTVGMLLGGLSSGVLLARALSGFVGANFGWRAMFASAAALDLALFAVVARLPHAASLAEMRYRDLIRSLVSLIRIEPALRISIATGFLAFGAFSAFWATLAALLAQPPYHFGPATVGAFGLVGLIGLVASPYIGSLVDRIHPSLVSAAGAVTVLLAFASLSVGALHLSWLVASMVLLDLGNRAAFIANQARIYSLRPEARSRLNTAFMVSYFLGGAAGAAIGGFAAKHNGWTGLALVGAVLALLALVASGVGYRKASLAVAPDGA